MRTVLQPVSSTQPIRHPNPLFGVAKFFSNIDARFRRPVDRGFDAASGLRYRLAD